jgi:L-asparagine transporter-like permease
MPLFPLAPILGLIALCFVVYTSLLTDDGRLSLEVNAGAIVLSFIYYRLVLARRGAWVLRGPEDS